jgi:hypothetical protein
VTALAAEVTAEAAARNLNRMLTASEWWGPPLLPGFPTGVDDLSEWTFSGTPEPDPGMVQVYLGTHKPHWLADPDVVAARAPLFISRRQLENRRGLPRARTSWALDSGGFSELGQYGRWELPVRRYVELVRRFDEGIGKLEWAAPMDLMCEPEMVAKTGLSIREHQRRTVGNYLDLMAAWPEDADSAPFMPTVQGWDVADYLACVEMYSDAGIDLTQFPLVAVGSICRKNTPAMVEKIVEIITALHALDIRLHGFGLKADALARVWPLLASADSLAWSYGARRAAARGITMPGCTHPSCSNCKHWALAWRKRTLARMTWQVAA